MRYFKLFLLANVLLCSGVLAAQTPLGACMEQGKKEFAGQDFVRARASFTKCLQLDNKNVDALLSLGGVCLKQDDLDGAQNYFLAALKNMKRSSPYFSYTYSMLGDIALKKGKNKAALAYYNRSLSFNEAYVNSLVGKAVITQAQGDQKAAAEMYKTALAVEPLNLIARKRLIALEPVYFSDEEMLEALKQRYAVLPDKKELSDSDRELFVKMHSAEQRGGIDYLKEKYPKLPADYTVVLFKDTGFAREVLTISGYNALQKQIGQDAIGVFQKAGVRMQDVFDLRDMKGQKIFLPDSSLTDSGFFVYTEALQGRKAYLLPKEAVPPSQDFLDKVAKRVDDLYNDGYVEISRTELEVVKQQTACSEETLRKHLGLYVLPVTKKEKHYFVLARDTGSDHKNAPYYFVQRYRARRNPSLRVPENKLVERYSLWNLKLCSVDGDLLTE